MLEHLGEKTAAASIVARSSARWPERTLRTRDLGGNADTTACGKAVAEMDGVAFSSTRLSSPRKRGPHNHQKLIIGEGNYPGVLSRGTRVGPCSRFAWQATRLM